MFEHWEPIYPSPELAALVAVGVFEKDARILDVGCGGGLDAIFLAQCGFDLIGIDISPAALRVAKRRARKTKVRVDWRLGDVLALPLEDEAVDFIIDRGLLHVIDNKCRSKYSSELYRVLKPHGRVLIRGASKKSSKERFNPITEKVIRKYFPRFRSGPLLPIPLFSPAGALDGRIAFLTKR